ASDCSSSKRRHARGRDSSHRVRPPVAGTRSCMHKAILSVAALWLVAAAPVHGQRRLRVGPTYSSITLEDLSGNAHSFSSFGGSAALITGDEGETGVTVSRYNDLATDGGVRLDVGGRAVATLEGRFLQVPGSQIQALEARLNASLALGSRHMGEFLEGTLGPAASVFISVSGSWRGRAPFAGVRFRRDTKKAGTVGLQIDFAPLKVTSNCSPPGASRTPSSSRRDTRRRPVRAGGGCMAKSVSCSPACTLRARTVVLPRACTGGSAATSTAAE